MRSLCLLGLPPRRTAKALLRLDNRTMGSRTSLLGWRLGETAGRMGRMVWDHKWAYRIEVGLVLDSIACLCISLYLYAEIMLPHNINVR